jgi:hypothetical protein
MTRNSPYKPRNQSSGVAPLSWFIAFCMLLITAYLVTVGVPQPEPTRVYLTSDVVEAR